MAEGEFWNLDELREKLGFDAEAARAGAEEAAQSDIVGEHPEAKGLPPMTDDEARELLQHLLGVAEKRALSFEEGFLAGQLVASFEMAVRATALTGRKGRYWVISEEQFLAAGGQQ